MKILVWLLFAWAYRREIFGRRIVPTNVTVGGFPSGWIERPVDAPPFTEEAVKRIYGRLHD